QGPGGCRLLSHPAPQARMGIRASPTKGQNMAAMRGARERASRRLIRFVAAAGIGAVACSLVALPAAADNASPHGDATPTTSTSSPPSTSTPSSPATTAPTTTAPPTTTTTAPALPEPPKDVAGQYIVTLKPGVDPDAIA